MRYFLFWFVMLAVRALGQNYPKDIIFVSDTQAPMAIETIVLRPHDNEKATALIFDEIRKQKPRALFILGDVVSKGPNDKAWENMDKYLAQCRGEGIPVTALLGNHDVMGDARKGEQNFQKRFEYHVRTGFVQIVDSVAVVLLNSNFKTLSPSDLTHEIAWLSMTLQVLDEQPQIQTVIVTCHHAPYSHSKLVGSSKPVQDNFVPAFLASKKAKLFITGHAHDYEHFKIKGKDFLTIGGGGGLHHPLKANPSIINLAPGYNPMFHFLKVHRSQTELVMTSYYLKDDFSGFSTGNSFIVPTK